MPTRKTPPRSEDTPAALILANRAESTLDGFADDLSRLLGTAQTKAEAWLGQRQSIAEQLTRIRDAADRWISQLTGANSGPGRRGRSRNASAIEPSASSAEPTRRRKRRTMSAEARAKISAAQRARWAKQKARK